MSEGRPFGFGHFRSMGWILNEPRCCRHIYTSWSICWKRLFQWPVSGWRKTVAYAGNIPGWMFFCRRDNIYWGLYPLYVENGGKEYFPETDPIFPSWKQMKDLFMLPLREDRLSGWLAGRWSTIALGTPRRIVFKVLNSKGIGRYHRLGSWWWERYICTRSTHLWGWGFLPEREKEKKYKSALPEYPRGNTSGGTSSGGRERYSLKVEESR